jgi:hypothetical protein
MTVQLELQLWEEKDNVLDIQHKTSKVVSLKVAQTLVFQDFNPCPIGWLCYMASLITTY